ncbi:DNA-binding GntR family transcriptional regulator [Amycolatopsis bartoniae]|uniref:HTH gntR-type domain-containing protein n=1 Tax=Amycolatopsis bartoniae TaxID=941986 RepID=A0A8H9ING6_9PSEU|nr:GntR family transcriptional regulator [Amycolatopsis bartoniae]MBB2939897.1 DNA-binding GntR family transcriptional regulator [Amycolatopsis bartoniae]TVT08316.1 GntR family transcriptional regulator [Amycolatopsis bartoniae]GHF35799.1 hypothetical protein GCM10017566_05980 [Amycolatopsis bartoniae]
MSPIHQRVADTVFEQLHERIVTGELAPGDRIDPTEVADSLGVSRTPVREAILRLEGQGLVERLPYRGVVVAGIDLTAAEDVAAMRIHLETLAVRTAVPRLTDEDLARMRRVNDEIREAVRGADAQNSFRSLNRAFHETLYRAAGSGTLLRLVQDLSAQAERFRLHFDVRQGRAIEDHDRILDACDARDPAAAVAATRAHILGAHLLMMPEDYTVPPGSALDVALRESGAPATTAGRAGRVAAG